MKTYPCLVHKMPDFQTVNQALLVVLVIAALFFAVRSVRKAPVREGMDSKDSKKSLVSKIADMKKSYDGMIKKDAPSKNQQLAALQDAKEAQTSAGIFFAMNAFATGDNGILEAAPQLVALRQLIDQAIADVKGGGSSGGSSMSFGGGDGGGSKSSGSGDDDGDSGGGSFF